HRAGDVLRAVSPDVAHADRLVKRGACVVRLLAQPVALEESGVDLLEEIVARLRATIVLRPESGELLVYPLLDRDVLFLGRTVELGPFSTDVRDVHACTSWCSNRAISRAIRSLRGS